jgi:hypothetical protein
VKTRIEELALQAGGSHFPTVGGKNLESFADLLIKDVLEQVKIAPTLHCSYTTYDRDMNSCIVEKITNHIKEHYDIQ